MRNVEEEVERLRALLVAKNQDYGSSAFEPPEFTPGLTARDAILVRVGDKVKRLRTLARNPASVSSETFDDTVRDLAGYCLLYLAAKEQD